MVFCAKANALLEIPGVQLGLTTGMINVSVATLQTAPRKDMNGTNSKANVGRKKRPNVQTDIMRRMASVSLEMFLTAVKMVFLKARTV